MKKVILSVVMSMFLVFTMMPAEAFADDYEAVVDVNNADPVRVDTNVITDPDEKVIQKDGKVTVNCDVPSGGANEKGVQAEATNGVAVDVTVNGNVSANGKGIDAKAVNANSTTKVEVGGSVTSGTGSESQGVNADARNGGKTTVNVSGNVTSNGDAMGSHGVLIFANNGEASVKAVDVTGAAAGILVTSETGSSVKAEVQNVTGNGRDGLAVQSYGGIADVLINGTVKGKEGGIYVDGDIEKPASNIKITVWRIVADEGSPLVRGVIEKESYVKEIKDNIHYIVKIDEKSEGVTFSATKGGDKLDPIDAKYGLGTAKSGDTVRYKVALKPGYKLDGAYDSDGNKVELKKDDDGNYYVDVPVTEAGGIYLSVATSKTKHNISYNLDGGSYNGQIGTITEVYDYGTAIKLLGTPTREGYRFLYWRGSQYDAGADYTVEGDHLFTAVWEKIVPQDTDDTQDSYTPKTAAKASPATGDESELALWISIMTAAVLALVYTFVRRREYNK